MADFLTELKRLSDAATKRPWKINRRVDTRLNESCDLYSGYNGRTACTVSDDDVTESEFEANAKILLLLVNRAERIAALVEATDAFVWAWQNGRSLAMPLANYMTARNALDESEAAQ